MSEPRDGPVSQVDLSDEPVHWDLGASQSYGEYLGLAQRLWDGVAPCEASAMRDRELFDFLGFE